VFTVYVRIKKKNLFWVGSLLVVFAFVGAYIEETILSSSVLLSPSDVFASKVSSLPQFSFFILVLASAALLLLGVVGVIFLLVSLSEK
jgi:hypothetical protein